jgi:hypothetical protein
VFPLGVGKLSEPIGLPPVHGVPGVVSGHSVQLTVPLGAPPDELPVTVAVSPQAFPTVVALGARTVVVRVGVAAVTAKHSAGSVVPEMLSSEPWYLEPEAGV